MLLRKLTATTSRQLWRTKETSVHFQKLERIALSNQALAQGVTFRIKPKIPSHSSGIVNPQIELIKYAKVVKVSPSHPRP